MLKVSLNENSNLIKVVILKWLQVSGKTSTYDVEAFPSDAVSSSHTLSWCCSVNQADL